MKIRFIHDFRCFKAGQTINLPGPISVIVGESGSGKSTLLRAIVYGSELAIIEKNPKGDSFFFFDFEFDSPRVRPLSLMDNDQKINAMQASMMSHGQSNWTLLKELEEAENCTIVLDEPDAALSPKRCLKLWSMIKKAVERNCSFLISTHSPILIQLADQVFDLESLKLVRGKDYLFSQIGPVFGSS